MNGQEIARLGVQSGAVKACIPLQMECTPPRLVYRGGWMAQFWYYAVDCETMEASEPAYFMELELPGGHPVRMERLTTRAKAIGQCDELGTQEHYRFIGDYLDRCTAITSAEPDQAQIEKLSQMWLVAHPFVLAMWFNAQEGTAAGKEPAQAKAEQEIADPVRYWKKEMAKAIRQGDDDAARRAREEMNRAAGRG